MISLIVVIQGQSQSLQFRVEVDNVTTGVQTDELRYSNLMTNRDLQAAVIIKKLKESTDCISILSIESAPLLLSASLQKTEINDGDSIKFLEPIMGTVSGGYECPEDFGVKNLTAISEEGESVIFLLNHGSMATKNVQLRGENYKDYVLKLMTQPKEGQLEDTHERQPGGQRAGAILTIGIEYL